MQRLPAHLQEPKRLYMGGVNLLCILSALIGALGNPIEAVRIQCSMLVVLFSLLFMLFLRGLSLRKMIHYGSLIGIIHVAVIASLSMTTYSSVQVWLVILCLTQFYVSGPRAGLLWTLMSLLSLLVLPAGYRLLVHWRLRHAPEETSA